ncbi:MAG: hypothetical protein ACK5HY_12230 [Parahaliea sp.]
MNDDIAQQIAAELQSDKLTSARCRELLDELRTHRLRVESRLALIGRGQRVGQQLGSERRALLEAGDTTALTRLNVETDELEAAAQIIEHQTAALTRRRTELLGRDAVAGMPGLYSQLEAALRAARAKREAYTNALDNVQGALQALDDARANAARAGLGPLPDGDPKLYKQITAVCPPPPPGELFGLHSEYRLERALGTRRTAA